MYKILTASGQDQRTFSKGREAEALKHKGRAELHSYFIAILPENIYTLENDKKQATKPLNDSRKD